MYFKIEFEHKYFNKIQKEKQNKNKKDIAF